LEGNVIDIFFQDIYKKHKEYLEGEESQGDIEKALEDEFECYLKIKFSSEQREMDIAKEIELIDETDEDPYNEKYKQDKKLRILQTIMGATIRTVFTDNPKIQYSLGDSCNFNEE
jgi:hypothetical protein